MREKADYQHDLKAALADNDGLRAVMQQSRPELLRFLIARAGDADLAQDLLQDLWLRLGHAQTGPVANPRAYLFRAANNLVLDYRRAQLRARLRDGVWLAGEDGDGGGSAIELRPDPAPSPEEALLREQEASLLRRAIEALPPAAARALRLHRLQGLSHTQVASEMGISRSGVEKHMAVAMKHLRKALVGMGCGEDGRAASLSQEGLDAVEPAEGKDGL